MAIFLAVYSRAFAPTLRVLESKLMQNSVLRSRAPLFFGDRERSACALFFLNPLGVLWEVKK